MGKRPKPFSRDNKVFNYKKETIVQGYEETFHLSTLIGYTDRRIVRFFSANGALFARWGGLDVEKDSLVRMCVYVKRKEDVSPMSFEMIKRKRMVVRSKLWCSAASSPLWRRQAFFDYQNYKNRRRGDTEQGARRAGRWKGFEIHPGDELVMAVSVLALPKDEESATLYRSFRNSQLKEMGQLMRNLYSIRSTSMGVFQASFYVPEIDMNMESQRAEHDRSRMAASIIHGQQSNASFDDYNSRREESTRNFDTELAARTMNRLHRHSIEISIDFTLNVIQRGGTVYLKEQEQQFMMI